MRLFTIRRFHRCPLVGPLTLGLLGVLAVMATVYRAVSSGHVHDENAPVPASAGAELSLQPGACEIVAVPDGQTLTVNQPIAGRRIVFRVRLLGVRLAAPSSEFDEQEIATAADRELIDLAPLGVATIELDKRRASADGAWLAYVTVNNKLVNAELIRSGWAEHDLYPGDSFAVARQLAQAQREARQERRGVWH